MAKRREVDILDLCRLGNIDPNTNTLVTLVHHVITIAKEKLKRPADAQKESNPPNKKKKGKEDDTVCYSHSIMHCLWKSLLLSKAGVFEDCFNMHYPNLVSKQS